MHLVHKITIDKSNSNFPMVDFISFKAKQLNNQILYTIRQPWLYYDNLKNNKPVYPNQLQLIQELNTSIQQYNLELTERNKVNEYKFNQDKVNNKENSEAVFKPKKLLTEISSDYYWTDNKDLLQFYAKNLINYQILNSKSGQQIIQKVIDNFSSYRGLLKLYKENKAKGLNPDLPQAPYYKEKLYDRSMVEFSNQQFSIKGKFIVIGWQGNYLKGLLCKNKLAKSNSYTEEIELTPNELNNLSYKDKNGLTSYHLKNNKNLKQEIINQPFINHLGQNDYKIILRNTYFNLNKKLRVKLPQGFDKNIKQIRLVPSTTANPLAYTLELVYEEKQYELNNLVLNHQQKPLLEELNKILSEGTLKQQEKATAKFIAGGYKISVDSLIKINNHNNKLASTLKICSLDPGMKRLFTLTNNVGLNPVIFKDNAIVAFNQWYNKIIAQHQEEIKTQWDKNTSKKLKSLNVLRENKMNHWMHLLSNRIVQYLVQNNFDLLVIGKNKGQKQEINIGVSNNQKFVQIPFNKLWDKIAYKAYQKGILVVEQEESYTSKACFLNHDFIPVYNKNIKEFVKTKFTGTRKKGLYQTQFNNNIITQFNIHSDVNGSYNILRKLLGRLGVDFQLNIENKTPHNVISRKLLHKLLMPTVVDFKSIDKVLNLKSNKKDKIKALEELDVKIIKTNRKGLPWQGFHSAMNE